MTRALTAADVQTGRVRLDARGHVRVVALSPKRPAAHERLRGYLLARGWTRLDGPGRVVVAYERFVGIARYVVRVPLNAAFDDYRAAIDAAVATIAKAEGRSRAAVRAAVAELARKAMPPRAVAGRSRAVLLDSGDAVRVPVATRNTANGTLAHAHWSKRSALAKRVRAAVAAGAALLPPALRTAAAWIVVLTREGPGTLDTDNLAVSLKAARDGAADALGWRDDADPRVRWVTRQARAKTPAVVVRVVALRGITERVLAGPGVTHAARWPDVVGTWRAHATLGEALAAMPGLPDEATARRVALDLLAALVGVAEEG